VPQHVRMDRTAERRQVTVMFSDLVGSTPLSARMDPEDLREIISAYQKCVAETVQRFGGFVAKYMGDGVLVYFGYPQAHEDDAERAVRAGLELIQALGGLKSRAPMQTRVGIATGLVVVGDLIGSGEAQERGIVGETPNLAAQVARRRSSSRPTIAPSSWRCSSAVNSKQNQADGTRTASSSEAMFVKLKYAMAAGCLVHAPAGPRPAPSPAQHYFPTEE
jgi:Adenylate and Guanylate cyclase catalytic domain